MLAAIPADQLLLETDIPTLTEPYRRKPTLLPEGHDIREAERIRDVSRHLAQQIRWNFNSFPYSRTPVPLGG